jgi:hypothetical protein
VGERRFERVFRRDLGTSPKHFARITRFLSTCRTLREGGFGSLGEAAQTCCYADRLPRAVSGLSDPFNTAPHGSSYDLVLEVKR